MKFAIAGAGYIAEIHAKALQNNGASLTTVIERFPEKACAFAEKLGAPGCYAEIEEALAQADFDALVIGTPNFLHAPQAIAALRAGKHVLVEKPMAMNSVEAQAMAEAAQQSGACLMVAHCWRFDQDVLWLRERVGQLGKIIRTKGYGVHTHWGPAGWFTQQALAGGGALADMGIHALDTARFLLGDPQPVSVYAKMGTNYKDFDVDDTGVMIVEWDNGATSYIESGWWQPHSDGPEAATQVYGTRGFGRLFPTRLELPNPQTEQVEVEESGFAFPRVEHCPQEMYDAQMAYFIDCINRGTTPVPGAQEGLVNMKVVDAAYQSSKTRKVVEIA
ncbi:MAG: Gfo/Idh/MocA family oxidoreductase [Anaerolineae bacterium]|nr:Gfo/Idh/MocA family oxidoreductase [Anaerolineae bacterium]